MRAALFFVLLCCYTMHYGQQSTLISGTVVHGFNKQPIQKATLGIIGFSESFFTDKEGSFKIQTELKGSHVLQIQATDCLLKQIPIFFEGRSIDLGQIFVEQDLTIEKTDNLITLTENDISNDSETISGSSGLLQSTRDIFLGKAAFDFGQAFFRVRGYDSRNGMVMINGIPMNKLFNGRPDWNNWGGLNDATRNQDFTNALDSNPYTFGGILGNTNMDTRPSGSRPGIRLSGSASNRTYGGRLMATYSSGVKKSGLAYTVSSSRRWSDSGYVEGTLYDAYSFFGALEYQLNPKHSIVLTSILAKNRRGRSAALTEEVFDLMGSRYNPYWGNQDGKMRNSRERQIFEPLVLFNHYAKSSTWNWNTGIAYQIGSAARSRVGYYNASSPDPTYYRYLPSFYLNSPIGADFNNATLAKQGFLEDPQMDWESLYVAHTNQKAAYLFYDDQTHDERIMASTSFGINVNERIKIEGGLYYQTLTSENYAEIQDLMGADFHEDMDTFSNTLNDLNGSPTKIEGEKFNYHYKLQASEWEGFGQIRLDFEKIGGFVSAAIGNFNTQREGLFQNERFLDNSMGKSEKIDFSNIKLKAGATYFLSGRHWFTASGALVERPPTIQNIFINPRENNAMVPEILNETIATADINYHIRLPDLTGRITAFYTRFMNTTDINFFYVDSGLGSDFVQEAITELDKLHKGIEFGLQYELSSSVKVSMAGNLGAYVYASDPSVQINFDTAAADEDLISTKGSQDLGIAKLKGLKLAQGPQTAFAVGVEYRSPRYWWMGATGNHLANSYIDLSAIRHTNSFLLDPETGERFPNATDENVSAILKQRPLNKFYLLNLIGGKSWLVGKKYVSAFISVNNLFDEVFKSGGYEQGRNGNYGQLYQDNLSGSPSFGPKYWYGYGRTYFLNLAVSF
ncbi:TonB-dependent receptor [Flagellimonas sp.]|uniref:TonB-dependent receptor n=1 Tax=Flagellimonas sp. TaxID=2058762 RepID=UPI003B508C11